MEHSPIDLFGQYPYNNTMKVKKYSHSDTVRVIDSAEEYYVLAYSEDKTGTFLAVNCHAGADDFVELTDAETELVDN